MAKEVIDLYTKHTRYRTKPNMNEIVSVVLVEMYRHSTVFVVVDALDECPEDGRVRAKFVEKLQHIWNSTTSTKTKERLLVTTRLTKQVFLDAVEIEIRASNNDIKRIVYQRIKKGLSNDDEISQLVRQNDTLKDTLVGTIVKSSGNMYLHLRWTSVIADCTDRYCRFLVPKLQLDSLATKTTLRSLREAIKCAPEDLDDLYTAAWNRINSQNKDSARDAKEALCWLSCSFRQLEMQELRHALATRSGDKVMCEENLMNFDRLVRSCEGLVTVDTRSQIVLLSHQTVQDFFRTRASELFPDAHTRLARTCLMYLLFDEFSQGPCDTTSALKHPFAATRIILTRLECNPFMEYAAHHWGDHGRGETTERALEREILGFLSTKKALASTVQVHYANEWRNSSPGLKRLLNSSKHTPVHVVVSFALEHILMMWLQTVTDKDLNVEDESKKTAFHWAVELGLDVCARTLLDAGANIRTRDDIGFTALHKASAFCHASIVEMILEHEDTAEISAVEVTCAMFHSQKLFLERYIRSAPKLADRANSFLMQSLAEPGLIDFAISLGADVNYEHKHGRIALMEAVDTGSITAVQALIATGASINVLEIGTRKSLLQVAASSRISCFDCPDLLGKIWHRWAETASRRHWWGSPMNPVRINDLPRCLNTENSNPIFAKHKDSEYLAALDEDYEYPDIIRLLLDNGADLGIKTSHGETVLHLAVGSAARVKVLLDMGAHELGVDAQDNEGRSALHHAAAVGNPAAMEVLLANGASLEMRDFGGASTLHYAVGHSDCVELAIRRGSSTKAVDSRKRTALHYFKMIERPPQKQGDPDVCNIFRQLLEAGVDSDAIDSQGKKASDYLLPSSEVTAHWMGMQLIRGLNMLEQAKIWCFSKWRCEDEDTWDDLNVLGVFHYLVNHTSRYM